MKAAVIDASVAVKLVTLEDYSDQADQLVRSVPALYAPAHFLAEASNVLWAKVAIRRTLAPELLIARLDFLTQLAVGTTPLPTLIVQAGSIAMELNVSVYDALYLALVERTDAPLVSDDRRLIAAGKRSARFSQKVIWIGDFAA